MSTELDILRAWEAPGDDGASDAEALRARARARARLEAHIAAPARARPARAPGRRRWWLVAAPGAIAAAAVAIAVVLSVGSDVEHATIAPAPASAAAALDRAAQAAERRGAAGSPFPRPGEFFYVKTQATYMDESITGGRPIPSLDTRTREVWTSFEHVGRLDGSATTTRWPSAAARARWVAAGRPALNGPGGPPDALPKMQYFLGNERLSYEQVRDFGQTPRQVFDRLVAHYQKGQGGGLRYELFTWVGDALREQPAPAKLRAALYRTLALIPGVRYLGHVRDRLGRPALAVAQIERGTRRELLFDPDTSEVLAERDVMVSVPRGLKGVVPAGTVTTDAVYVRRAVVERLGQRP